jgi:hypothetical protein
MRTKLMSLAAAGLIAGTAMTAPTSASANDGRVAATVFGLLALGTIIALSQADHDGPRYDYRYSYGPDYSGYPDYPGYRAHYYYHRWHRAHQDWDD